MTTDPGAMLNVAESCTVDKLEPLTSADTSGEMIDSSFWRSYITTALRRVLGLFRAPIPVISLFLLIGRWRDPANDGSRPE
jgi:hypothetical protein